MSLFLGLGAVWSGTILPAAHSLALAVLAAFVTVALRLVYWIGFLVGLGLDRSAEADWLRATRVSAAVFFAQPDGLSAAAALQAIDITVLIGAGVAVLGIRALAPSVSWPAATVAGLGYATIAVCARVSLSLYAGFPI
jgi:hypothetical protein